MRNKYGLTPKRIQEAFDDELVELVLDQAWSRFRDDLPALISAGKGDRVAKMISTLPKGCWVVLLTTMLEYKMTVAEAARSPEIAALALEAYKTLGAQAHVDYLKWLTTEGTSASPKVRNARDREITFNTDPSRLRIKYIRGNPYEFMEEDR